jgi:hypothetical protein
MRGSAAFRVAVAPGGALAGPWVQNSLWTAARAVPSLDLRFADNKSLVDATTGASLVTFTRASSGTFVGSDGLLRSAVTNLVLRSEEFDNAYWTKSGATVLADQTASPIGSVTADKLIESAANAEHWTGRLSLGLSSAIYTCSIYAKAAERTSMSIFIDTSVTRRTQYFNLSTGTLESSSGGITSSIQSVGNGWYRCSITLNAAEGFTNAVYTSAIGNSNIYTGDGTSGIFLWGAQLEQSSTAGEYIPTTSVINSAPRFDHNPTTGESLGLLVEEARTNSFTNNTMVGAVAGTPGTLPTGWPFQASSNGLAVSIVGTGTESGITYLDWRISGTATAAAAGDICFGRTSALTAQTWTASSYLRLVAGNLSGVTGAVIGLIEETAAFTFITGALYSISLPTTNSLITQRPTASRTLTGGALVALLRTNLTFNVSSGSTVDFTIRIGLPQLEQGAFATSVIPTGGAGVITPGYTTPAVTRAADVASITGSAFSSWYRQDEGSFFCSTTAPKGIVVYGTGDTFDNTQYVSVGSSNNVNIRSGGASIANLTAPISTTALTNIAYGYAADNFAAVSNGGVISTDTSGAVPLAQVRLKLGSSAWDTAGLNNLNGTIRRLTYWPTRFASTTLQAITQP